MYDVVFTKQAIKDAPKLKAAGLDVKANELIAIVADNPFAYPPSYEPLVGSLAGMYSRRINWQHRFVYEVLDKPFKKNGEKCDGTVKVLSMWTHYESL